MYCWFSDNLVHPRAGRTKFTPLNKCRQLLTVTRCHYFYMIFMRIFNPTSNTTLDSIFFCRDAIKNALNFALNDNLKGYHRMKIHNKYASAIVVYYCCLS